MSTAHAAPSAGDHAGHGHADHAHDFDGEPATELPPDEPLTPGWVPVLGAVLFLTAGVAFLAMSDKPAAPGGAAAAPSASAAAANAVKAPPEVTQRPTPTLPVEGSDAARAAQRLSGDQLKGLQEMIDKERAKRNLPPLPAQGAPSPAPTQ